MRPWLPDKAIDFIEDVIDEDSLILEHGAGGSTVWFAERVRFVLSFETDPKWYSDIGRHLDQRGLIHSSIKPMGTAMLIFASDIRSHSFRLPVTAPSLYDLVLVDGRGRVKFWEKAQKYLKPGGWLVFDDAEREKYKYIAGTIRDWEEQHRFYKPDKPHAFTIIARKPDG